MQLIKNTIELGIEKPFSFLHLSDTHLALADGRDDDRKRKLARERSGCFSKAEMLLSQAQRYALENDLLIVHTGDLIDFVSEANLDRAHALVQENDVFFAAGNHEFSLYVGEAFEDAAYRNISLKKVQSCFHNNIRFDSRKMNGVNLIVIDNGYYLFDAEQLEALKKEVEYGLPIILFMHTPLFDEQLYEFLKAHDCIEEAVYLAATPEDLMTNYSEYRYRQQRADDITLETVAYIKSQPLIKAIFTGHLHQICQTQLTNNTVQYVSNGNCMRHVRVQ